VYGGSPPAVTPQRVLDAAAVVFAERGYEAATLDVAAAAAFSKGAVYSHFTVDAGLYGTALIPLPRAGVTSH
jgi:Bacterial regulatory proteins, tetR family